MAATSSDTADTEPLKHLEVTVDGVVEMKSPDYKIPLTEFCNASMQIEDCIGCKSYNKNRILENKVIDLKVQLQDKNESLSNTKKGLCKSKWLKSYPLNPLMLIFIVLFL